MTDIIHAGGALLLGLAGLIWGADRFITASAGGAKSLGVSPIVIGLTVVAFGTSTPEVIVAVNAALLDAGELAIGNALGSNIANIGLVLGITALVTPLPAQKHLTIQEGPALLLVTALAGLCLFDATLGRTESILMLLMVPILLWVTVKYKSTHPDEEEKEFVEEIATISTRTAVIGFLVGLATMLLSSNVMVWGAKEVAAELGMSQLFIGLTIVAIGTSLPELAASVAGALRGHHDIAIGNVFGSNMFNFLLVMPTAGVISPLDLDSVVFFRDYGAVCVFTVILVGAIYYQYLFKKPGVAYLSRRFGALMLIGYVIYFVLLLPTR